jgi:anti-sigma factor RsiW
MKSKIELQQLNAFVDGELDLLSQIEFEVRIKQDAALRAQVEGLQQLRESLRDAADYHAAPAALRKRIGAAVTSPSQRLTTTRDAAGSVAVLRWLDWRAMLVALGGAALLALALKLTWWPAVLEGRLMQDVVASHVRSTLGQHLVDVASSDHHVVKPWLSSKLDFSPPVRELQMPGSVFLGGRVDYLDGHPVAALVYRRGEHVVNSFVWPSSAADSRVSFLTDRGFQIARWSRSGMNHRVISDLNHAEFAAIVSALEGGSTAP